MRPTKRVARAYDSLLVSQTLTALLPVLINLSAGEDVIAHQRTAQHGLHRVLQPGGSERRRLAEGAKVLKGFESEFLPLLGLLWCKGKGCKGTGVKCDSQWLGLG